MQRFLFFENGVGGRGRVCCGGGVRGKEGWWVVNLLRKMGNQCKKFWYSKRLDCSSLVMTGEFGHYTVCICYSLFADVFDQLHLLDLQLEHQQKKKPVAQNKNNWYELVKNRFNREVRAVTWGGEYQASLFANTMDLRMHADYSVR